MGKILSRCVLVLVTAVSLRAFAAADVPSEPTSVRPLLPGTLAPSLGALRADGTRFHRDAARLEKPVVVIFYRGGWCPYCNLHLAEMRHAEPELLAMGYEVVFISPDRPDVLYPSLREEGIRYVLLSDSDMSMAKAFGIAYRLDEKTLESYRQQGVDLQDASGRQHQMLPVPAVFVVSVDGLIRFQYANPDYKTRLLQMYSWLQRGWRWKAVNNGFSQGYGTISADQVFPTVPITWLP